MDFLEDLFDFDGHKKRRKGGSYFLGDQRRRDDDDDHDDDDRRRRYAEPHAPTTAEQNQEQGIFRAGTACRTCSSLTVLGGNYCHVCGAAVEKIQYCASCGTRLAENVKFCSQCGYRR